MTIVSEIAYRLGNSRRLGNWISFCGQIRRSDHIVFDLFERVRSLIKKSCL